MLCFINITYIIVGQGKECKRKKDWKEENKEKKTSSACLCELLPNSLK